MNKNQTQTKPKSKGVSAALIILSCILFIASGLLVFLGLNEVKLPMAAKDESAVSSIDSADYEKINSAFDDSIISVILDEVDVQSIDTLKKQTCRINTDDADGLLNKYTEYLDSLKIEGLYYNYISGDFDGDGEAEYYLEIFVPVRATFTALGRENDAQLYEDNVPMPVDAERVILYGDCYDGTVTFRSYYSENDKADKISGITVNNGVMNISYVSSSPEIFVVCTPYAVYEDYAYQPDAFRTLCESYSGYLSDLGYMNIYYYCTDICDAEGEETVFVYYDKEGAMYVRVLTFLSGKTHFIYENRFDSCATFIIDIDSQKYLLEYSQTMGNAKNDYTATYHYSVFRFNSSYVPIEYESAITEVEYEKITSENEGFFTKFNSYLVNAFVLADPYELTGYKSLTQSEGMSTHKENSQTTPDEDESAYLHISNCSTSKQGIINVPESSYLNFREGPSVDYAKILINPGDSESYVRQLKGSSVTVIDTVNTTGDEENPIWLRIQIKYNALTLIGYSSQAWIDLPGIKHISKGSTFTVTADTNENSLTWASNDSSVARINASTGEITAVKPGLVLITVTSESGLSDSCLIAVD